MRHSRFIIFAIVAVLAALAAYPAAAQFVVTDAWIRATAPGQKTAGAYMQIMSGGDAALVRIATPVARSVELHSMRMDSGVMKMTAIDRVPLPAGKTVQLKSGAVHAMLVDLKQALKEGDTVPLTLTVEDKAGNKSTFAVTATVKPLNTP